MATQTITTTGLGEIATMPCIARVLMVRSLRMVHLRLRKALSAFL